MITACGLIKDTPCAVVLVKPTDCWPQALTPGAGVCGPLDAAVVVRFLQVILAQLNRLLGRLEGDLALRNQEYLSIKQAAAILGVDERHTRRAVAAGKLPCSNISNGDKKPLYRIARSDLEAWVRNHPVSFSPPKSEREELVDQYLGARREKRKNRLPA
jgi:excisionase family DNA binding protein